MSEISKYNPSPNQHGKMRPEPFGNWVAFTDYEAEIKALKESIDKLLEELKLAKQGVRNTGE